MSTFLFSTVLLSFCCGFSNSFIANTNRHFFQRNTEHISSNLQQTYISERFRLSMKYDYNVDVVVVGGGIAGTALSWLLQEQHDCKVAIIDSKANGTGTWYPNYGEWRDEWHVLSDRMKFPQLRECTTTEWEITECFFGGSYEKPMDNRLTLQRPYVRVDRKKLQAEFRQRYESKGGIAITGKILSKRIAPNLFDQNLAHDQSGTTITLEDGQTVRSKIVIDATGFESRLTVKESTFLSRGSQKSFPTGYQIAYGYIAHVDSLGPYDSKAMTLFDYRTSFLEDDPAWLKEATNKPTFMYVMPLSQNKDGTYRVFMEETSLVGRDSRRLTFEECKKRAYKRMQFHNMKVLEIEEEEYCYIPMGGELPDRSQRIIAFGAAANMVHPSTGYQACRMLAASTEIAKVIGNGLKENQVPDRIASLAYDTLWNKKTRRQRDFQAFGGDFLMAQPVQKLRGFFMAFFSVEQPIWAGFLAGYPGLPGNENHETWNGRIMFAMKFFFELETEVKITMILFAIKHTLEFGPSTLLRSLLPDFPFWPVEDEPLWQPPPVTVGAVEAKNEARKMMIEFANEQAAKEKQASSAVVDVDYPAPFEKIM